MTIPVMDSHLSGQCVLVTGASGAIGQATVRVLAAEGVHVALHYHRHADAAETLVRELSRPEYRAPDAVSFVRTPSHTATPPAGGPLAAAFGADLRDEPQVDRLFAEVTRAFGRIDAVVANAGIWTAAETPLQDMTLAQWRATLDADLTGVFLTCRGFLRHLAAAPRDSAALVLVGSTAALFGEAGHADYAAAKAGLTYGLTRSLKNEIVKLAPRGRVNCVCPGWVQSPMAAPALPDTTVLRRVCATIPLNKIATVEDVAHAIVFLLSDRLAGHLSGTILPVAGGMEGRLLNPM